MKTLSSLTGQGFSSRRANVVVVVDVLVINLTNLFNKVIKWSQHWLLGDKEDKPVFWHGLTLILAWISNYSHYNMWGEITYPFLNFNVCTVEV